MEADPQRREELVQEIHLQLWRSFQHFDGRCSERTWVFRVAHNVTASHVDAERRRPSATVPMSEVHPDGNDLFDVIERRSQVDALHRLIRELPLVDRQVLLLTLEGMGAAEIGEVVGCSPGAVSTRLHRLKPQLAEQLRGRA